MSSWRQSLESRDKRWTDIGLAISYAALILIVAGATVGVTLSGLSDVHEGYAEYQKNAESIRQATQKEIEQSCLQGGTISASECLTEKLASYYETQSANQDLKAQKEMAWWAAALFALNAAQALIGCVGIYFVWHSLKLNRQAVDTAMDANTITRQIGQAQTRSYLTISQCDYVLAPEKMDLYLVIENKGQSPAVEVEILATATTHEIFQIGFGPEKRAHNSRRLRGQCQIVAAGGKSTGRLTIQPSDFSPNVLDAIYKHQEMPIYLTCRAVWLDVFGDRSEVKFSLTPSKEGMRHNGARKSGSMDTFNEKHGKVN